MDCRYWHFKNNINREAWIMRYGRFIFIDQNLFMVNHTIKTILINYFRSNMFSKEIPIQPNQRNKQISVCHITAKQSLRCGLNLDCRILQVTSLITGWPINGISDKVNSTKCCLYIWIVSMKIWVKIFTMHSPLRVLSLPIYTNITAKLHS